jgi:hypothetical protein
MTRIRFNSVNIALPVQKFDIRCHVSLERSVPVMTEFAVRLLNIANRMSVEQIRDYFGLKNQDCNELLKILTAENLIEFQDDYVVLSAYARTRFESSTDKSPRFTSIVERRTNVTFELLSFQHLPRELSMAHSSCALELKVKEDINLENTKERAERAFHDQFHDIEKLNRVDEQKRAFGVYKVDEVSAGKRFNLPYPVHFELDMNGNIEQVFDEKLNLSSELKERLAAQVADTVHEARLDGKEAIIKFSQKFDEPLINNHVGPLGFDLNGYVSTIYENLVSSERGDNDNSKKLLKFGAAYLPQNVKEISKEIRIAVHKYREENKGVRIPPVLYWLAPSSVLWGRTKLLGDAIDDITAAGRSAIDNKRFSVSVIRQIEKRFVNRERSANGDAGILDFIGSKGIKEFHRYELLVIPGIFMAAYCYVAIPSAEGGMAPIGFVSYDSKKIKIAENILSEFLVAAHTRNKRSNRDERFEEVSIDPKDFEFSMPLHQVEASSSL